MQYCTHFTWNVGVYVAITCMCIVGYKPVVGTGISYFPCKQNICYLHIFLGKYLWVSGVHPSHQRVSISHHHTPSPSCYGSWNTLGGLQCSACVRLTLSYVLTFFYHSFFSLRKSIEGSNLIISNSSFMWNSLRKCSSRARAR